MSGQPMAKITPVKKTREQIEAEAKVAGAARAAMTARAQAEVAEEAQAKAFARAQAEAEAQARSGSRQERIARAWKVRDDALWNPFEVAAFIGMIIFGFGFLLGRDHFFFAMELFFPVIVIGIAVLILQAGLRRKAGERGVLSLMRDRIR